MMMTEEGDAVTGEKSNSRTGLSKGLLFFARTLYVVALAGLIILVLGIVGLKVAGMSTLTVLTPSMEPSLMVGDVILVRDTREPIQVGGIYVGFSPEINAFLAHRVIGEGSAPGMWVTKGDANPSVDEYEFSSAELSREVVGSVPFLGNITSSVPRMGFIALLFLLAGGVYFWVLHIVKDEDAELPTDTLPSDSSLTEKGNL